jgi:hypothetical protein
MGIHMNKLSAAGRPAVPALALIVAGVLGGAPAQAATEQQSLEELRNTVVNLLQALVDQGVMTRERAQTLVKRAQDKAQADAAATAATAEAEKDAVHVAYVPEPVKEEIRKQVAADLRQDVAAQVLARAQSEKWGVPGALPAWVSKLRWYGDLRVRGQGDIYGRPAPVNALGQVVGPGNVQGVYLDFNAINSKGGTGKAGAAQFLNVTEDRYRLRVRARVGVEAMLGGGFAAGARITTGTLVDPGTENQTLGGSYGGRYGVGLDQAYVRWDSSRDADTTRWSVQAGRTLNPYLSTDLLFHRDLTFEGVSSSFRLAYGDSALPSETYVTLGAHPLQEVALSTKDKWLVAGQLGTTLQWGDGWRLRVAAAYYDYLNVRGRRNLPDSTLLDYTAPGYLQQGNTVFDIRNDTDVTTNLFALAGNYRLADLIVALDVPLPHGLQFSLTGDAVRNVGWKSADVRAVSGIDIEARTKGYQLEAAFGDPKVDGPWRWRTYVTYRYLQRDAVLDAFTDTDFRGGGTDVKGFTVGGDLGVSSNAWLRLRYLSGEQIDGAPFSLDTVQLDLNAQF